MQLAQTGAAARDFEQPTFEEAGKERRSPITTETELSMLGYQVAGGTAAAAVEVDTSLWNGEGAIVHPKPLHRTFLETRCSCFIRLGSATEPS